MGEVWKAQSQIQLGTSDAARHRPTDTDTDTDEKSLLYFGCDFSGGSYSFGKITQTVATPDVIF